VGFSTEILFMFMLGLVLLGPKRLHAMLGQVARVKAELDKATRGIKSQLSTELDDAQPASFPDEPVVPSKTLSGSHGIGTVNQPFRLTREPRFHAAEGLPSAVRPGSPASKESLAPMRLGKFPSGWLQPHRWNQ